MTLIEPKTTKGKRNSVTQTIPYLQAGYMDSIGVCCTSQLCVTRWHFGRDKEREISGIMVNVKKKNDLHSCSFFVSHVRRCHFVIHDVPQVSLVKENDLSFIGSCFGTLLLHSIYIFRFLG